MGKNIRPLTDEQIKYVKDNYTFKLIDNYIFVCCNHYDRKVAHDIHKPFSISTNVRKITISKEAIDMWINNFQNTYSLIDVHNAIVSLIVSYQPVNLKEVKKQLSKNTFKIQEI